MPSKTLLKGSQVIHEVSGDILLSKAQAIAHGVSPNDSFDQGLARSLREKWPMMHKDFRHYAHQVHPHPGEIWEWGGFGARVFNLLTQDGGFEHGDKPGRASLKNVRHCLKRLRHAIERDKIQSIAIPRLATGVGGLDWSEVQPLITEALGDLPIPVVVYSTYQPGVAASEPSFG
ncbi:MAG TPA: macro domain-containing protein [Caulifigura sp.]|nr:macro domain-containing protein [Caulifigura sp.]